MAEPDPADDAFALLPPISPDPPAHLPGPAPARVPAGVPVPLPVDPPVALSDPEPEDEAAEADTDWRLWLGTFQAQADARLTVWRLGDQARNAGKALLVVTAADALRAGWEQRATAEDFLRRRHGAGRYRLTPRTAQGDRMPGTGSFALTIPEDPAMPGAAHAPTPATTLAATGEAAVEIERMRLQAEMDRDRETRRERAREAREERRRERETERERHREEDRRRRDSEDQRRSERDLQVQTLMIQVLKEVASARGGGSGGGSRDDALTAAILAKLGQPDPLVLKLLDTHGKREELTDFFKVQAESLRMASMLQTDSLKQVMSASQEVQAHLLRQAAEVASSREGGNGWDGLGSVLAATANIIGALRGVAPTADASPPPQITAAAATSAAAGTPAVAAPGRHRLALAGSHSTAQPAAPALPVAPATAAVPPSLAMGAPVGDPVVGCLQRVRSIQRGEAPDSAQTLGAVAADLPTALAEAIRGEDVAAIQRLVLPAVQTDPSLGEWLGQPGVGNWISAYLQRLRAVLVGTAEGDPGTPPGSEDLPPDDLAGPVDDIII